MKVLFLIPYPKKESPSQRFRFEQYFKKLEEQGYQYRVQTFLNTRNWQIFFKPGKILHKAAALIQGFAKRTGVLFIVFAYDYVFIHREATPIGPPVFEWLISKVFRKKIIYDFDDAIWLTDRKNDRWWFNLAKWRNKVSAICTWSYKVSCGNHYLCAYAENYNKHVVYNPTTIDTRELHNPDLYEKNNYHEHITIGWTGSHSTLKYLRELEPVLKTITEKYPSVGIMIIADAPPMLTLQSVTFKPWSLQTEISDLMQADIGIMPLPDDLWAKGKCGFKALQYMALGIPAVVSAVGVNTEIVDDGKNGFCCLSEKEWITKLEMLIQDAALRKKMGHEGRVKVQKHYSVDSNAANFLALFS